MHNEFDYEVEVLQEKKNRINIEIERKVNEEEGFKTKISDLKKASRGSYSLELENTKIIYDIVSKNLKNYSEATENPYFGRIDFKEDKRMPENFYIGKYGIYDSKDGEEIVIDWRAPIADLYYSGTQGEAYYRSPVGVINGKLQLKRKFLIKDGELKDIFDEGINEIILKGETADEENELVDEFLKINLEESAGSKLKEVVATIQKEQNDIIRAPLNFPLIVQGSAGSGKTTVALHRLAYLVYRYNEKIKGEDILVLAPNKLFLDYISEILPNLGTYEVNQKTFPILGKEFLGLKGKIYTRDEKLREILEGDSERAKYLKNISKIKGSILFKTILDRLITIWERDSQNLEDIKIQGFTLYGANEIKRLYFKDLVHFPVNKRIEEIHKYFNKKLDNTLLRVYEQLDLFYNLKINKIKKNEEDSLDRRKKLIEIYDERDEKKKNLRNEAISKLKEYFEAWNSQSGEGLYYRLFEEDEIFEEATGEKIPKNLEKFMREEVLSNREKEIIDEDDIAALLYLKLKTEGIKDENKYKHIVIDEAQDYSPLMFHVTKMMCQGSSMTIVGDLGQGIYSYKGINNWETLIEDIFNGECTFISLSQSYRSTMEIIDVANIVLNKQLNAPKPAKAVIRSGPVPEIIEYNNFKDLAKNIDEKVEEIRNANKKSIAIICKDFEECKKLKSRIKNYSNFSWDVVKEGDKELNVNNVIIPSYLTKGLEFDGTILFNVDSSLYKDTEEDKKLLYVALTRALHRETIFYKGELTPLLEA
ncbi:RNA polymerase recycling motor HelD [Clostridium sp. 'White wine YQ']|uniref:RNA polymerase recycling motor HelD n=1 Tax=Clostridium sp. 'White wine YQ' TaxID=3027474 RepID=UPI002365559C|nr:RNA polymerase recycling motor HelD [Clostridium sp. 'White wine YQ']MDD7793024.1 RNA polymerase recycling motor HelD [Clostridium sp. 'White wine YQ']